jgi:hypothetical protein
MAGLIGEHGGGASRGRPDAPLANQTLVSTILGKTTEP